MDLDVEVPRGANIILIDGTCIFCNRLVAFILARDAAGLFHFAHLQGPLAQDALLRHGRDPRDVDGVYLLVDAGTPAERLLVDGAAGREIWPRLFKLAMPLRWIPIALLDVFYRVFARYRYRLFGKYDVCRLPTADERRRFVTNVTDQTGSIGTPS
ncbi:MAG TPA: DCC1-like thiol-disulfide oxidoreductase family protein [Labilithrix sp.]|nr:DCC1-like thiol-disulfide oxidoreductase family protein [Labilithrix sp.]